MFSISPATERFFAALAFLTTGFICNAAEPSTAEIEFFEKQIRPLLASKCFQCHAADTKQQGNLVLDSKAGWEIGGESGPAVVPGNPDESILISAIRFDAMEMPPSKQLTDDEIAIFVQWVEMGAPDPRIEGGPVGPHQIDIEKGREYWAFRPPQKTNPPTVRNKDWARCDIDQFVQASHEAIGLTPVADADRESLIRRVTFDLVGLPPEREEVEAFVNDPVSDRDALATVVDRLLASPHFGERWGRHWLDVARYGDSQANTQLRHAWQYRNYVIDSLNSDKPFNQFVREQIAGDLLRADDRTTREQQLIATGFLALSDRNPGQKDEVIDEQIDCTTKTFMALTVSCARCHDHKFDPIPTEDYYAMAGIFRSTQVQRTGIKNSPPLPLGDGDAKQQVEFEKKLDSFRSETLRNFETATRNRDRAQRDLNTLQNRYRNKPSDKPRTDVTKAERRLKLEQKKFETAKRAHDTALKELERLQQKVVCGVSEGRKPADQRLYIRGDRLDQGDVVPRGFVQVVSGAGAHCIEDHKQSGRLELADWIASEHNPLTNRTIVNRVWQHLFGVGIVPTVDNFGALGERPSHPELLDYLAVRFIENGWSVKQLIRQIVLSRTYQLSTVGNARNEELDGDNRLLWRMNRRRLDAESLRDAMLKFSGRLQLEPPAVGQLAELTFQRPNFEVPHRSVYLPVMRTNGYEFFAAFDGADPSMVVGRREVSTVPTQVLYLLNSPLVLEQSRLAAERIIQTAGDDSTRTDLAYWLALSRSPTDAERKWVQDFINNYGSTLEAEGRKSQTPQQDAWEQVCQALIASAEFQVLN